MSKTLKGPELDINDTPQVRLNQKLKEIKKNNENLNLSSAKKNQSSLPLDSIVEEVKEEN
jgi:hypothetical protein